MYLILLLIYFLDSSNCNTFLWVIFFHFTHLCICSAIDETLLSSLAVAYRLLSRAGLFVGPGHTVQIRFPTISMSSTEFEPTYPVTESYHLIWSDVNEILPPSFVSVAIHFPWMFCISFFPMWLISSFFWPFFVLITGHVQSHNDFSKEWPIFTRRPNDLSLFPSITRRFCNTSWVTVFVWATHIRFFQVDTDDVLTLWFRLLDLLSPIHSDWDEIEIILTVRMIAFWKSK